MQGTEGAGIRTDLALVVAHEGAAVILDDGGQVGRGESTTANPARKLVVPNAVVATEQLAVSLGEVGNLISTGECEGSA